MSSHPSEGAGVEGPLMIDVDRDTSELLTIISDIDAYDGDSLSSKVESIIKANSVVVFGKTYCPFCLDVKHLLTENVGVHIDVIEVNSHPQGAAIHKYIKEKTGHNTVPVIFIKGEYIGGCDDLKALHAKGLLEDKLKGLILKEHTMYAKTLDSAQLLNMPRGTACNPPFWFPNVVNNYVVRLTGLQVCTISVLSAVFYEELWGQYLAVGLLVDFVIRMFVGSFLSPLGMIATVVASPFRPQFKPGPPKQFASFCGVLFSLMGTIFYFVDFEGHDIVGAVFMAMLAGAAGLEAFLDICLGCLFYSWGIQFGIIPDTVYRIFSSSKQEIEDSWDYMNSNSGAVAPEKVTTDCNSKVAIQYKKKSDDWTKDDFHVIRHMQVTYFGMPLAIAGLALPFKIASAWGSKYGGDRDKVVPEAWYQAFSVVGAVVFAIMLFLFTLRIGLFPHKIATEWDCPLRSPSFGAISICCMIFAILLYDEIDFKETVTADDKWPQIMARVIFWIGAISHTLLTIIKMGEWVGRRLELEHVHAQWMILPVGLSIAALIAPTIPMFKVDIDSDNADIAQNMFVSRFFYSIAFLMWITLFVITFLKTVTTHNSDNRVRHGAFIWLAAPCAIGLADLTLCLVSVQENEICQDTFANYYFIGMFMFLSLAWASLPYLAYFGRDKFGMGYWTECFALDTLAACGATFYALNGFKASQNLMFIGLVMASLANMAAFLHTISAIIRRRGVFTPEVKWGPLSFMKLTHEAFRGNLTKLQFLLSELEVSSSSPETLGLFAAHYQRFFVVHEEHAKHEDEVIFKIFNDFFKDHAKHWNADHEEDHAKMEKWRGSADRLLDTDLDEDTRKTALSILKNELPEFFIHFREHLLGEEEHLQPIGRKYIPLELQKQMSRKVFELTPADRWEIIIPYVVLNVPRHEQRIRYLKVLTWAMPERAQQIGAIVYRNVDAVMWERLRVELPDIIPRGVANWKRYY